MSIAPNRSFIAVNVPVSGMYMIVSHKAVRKIGTPLRRKTKPSSSNQIGSITFRNPSSTNPTPCSRHIALISGPTWSPYRSKTACGMGATVWKVSKKGMIGPLARDLLQVCSEDYGRDGAEGGFDDRRDAPAPPRW